LARIQTIAGHGREALITVESLRSLPEPVSLDGRIALEESLAADSLANYHYSYTAALRAAELGREQGARWLVARANYRAAQGLWRLGELDEAEATARGAADDLGSLGDRAGQADAYNLLANIYELRGDLETSQAFYQTALANHRQLGNRAGESKVLNNLAYVMFRRQDEQAAEDLYNEALEVARSIDRKSAIARTLHNLAILRRHQERTPEAEEIFEQALVLAREIGDRGIQSTSLNNLGVLRRRRGDLAGSLTYFEASLELAKTTGDQRGLASGLNNLAITERQLGNLERARDLFEESRRLCETLGDQRNLGRRLVNLANVYRRWGKLDEARAHLQEAATIYADIEDPETDIALATTRAEIHLARIESEAGADDLAEELLRSSLESLETPSQLFRAHTLLARCLMRTERLDAAQELLAVEAAFRRANQELESNAAYDLAKAELDLRLGRWNDAQQLLTVTQRQLAEAGHLSPSLEAQLLLSDLLRARGNTTEARSLVDAVSQRSATTGLGHMERLAAQRIADQPID
jgi:tetratricopeptide (TPR) repeat protein